MVQNAFVALTLKLLTVNEQAFALGMVKVIDNQITESFHTPCESLTTLLKQILLYMASIPKMCKMPWIQACLSIYAKIFIDQLPVVAHNAAFDMNVHQSLKVII